MSSTLQIREVAESGFAEWREVVAQAEEGSPYQSPEYLMALADATNSTVRLAGVFRSGELVGGLGLYVRRNMLGCEATTRLLLYYSGPFVKPSLSPFSHNQQRHRRSVHDCLLTYLNDCSFRRIRFKTRQPQSDYRVFLDHGWRGSPVYTYVADLRKMQRLWDNVDNNLRRLVRRSETQGYDFTCHGSPEALVDMHEEIRRRKGAPLYMARQSMLPFLDRLVSRKLATVFQVNNPEGQPAAAQLVLHGEHPVAHTLMAGSTDTDFASGCNAFLRWKTFQWLADRQYQALDLTDAHHPSVSRFKSQLGADVQLCLQLERPQPWWAAQAESAWNLARRMRGRIFRLFRKGKS